MNKIVLILEVADDVNSYDVVEYLNINELCRMEEDLKLIKGWEWIYEG